jgi:glutamate-5-semialdehyde dehydrogenase
MAIAENQSLEEYCVNTARRAKRAAADVALADGDLKNAWLIESARRLRSSQSALLEANQADIDAAPGFGLTEAQTDRLRLDPDRIESIAVGLEEIAALPDPIGETIEETIRPNGLKITKVRVPLGVVFFIYESRPNVTSDASAICLKSGNAVILRGGKEAAHSSRAIVDILAAVAAEKGLPADAIQLVSVSDRSAVGHFLSQSDSIDLAIPRGGEALIRRVTEEATMPVLKHFFGNCHVYIDESADPETAERVTLNSKCQRLGVCNACESLLIHADVATELLPRVCRRLIEEGVEIRGDRATCDIIAEAVEATDKDYFDEYLAPIISVKVVGSLDEAIQHVNHYGSHHTDAIIATDEAAAKRFATEVDSAAVMINASTRFNDGAEFGLGAEIGISTDKFHARGPCGLKELTSYKYVVFGNGQIRE